MFDQVGSSFDPNPSANLVSVEREGVVYGFVTIPFRVDEAAEFFSAAFLSLIDVFAGYLN
jgi:hypothetical protein